MTSKQALAIVALVVGAATLILAVVVAVDAFPRGLGLLACLGVIGVAGMYGALRRGAGRIVGFALAALALIAAVVLLVTGGPLLPQLLVLVGLVVALGAARAAFAVNAPLPRAPSPSHPVLLFNNRSGGGKAEKFKLEEEATTRGIEAIELRPGLDLEVLARDAVARGADALAMAGGDGSQAIVAMVAAEHDLPYACIPAGTRNHFALDLGVDRDDVIGALGAFVDGGERRVDLAEVNGRVFVNNVSLGLYAEAVQKSAYRNAKLRTIIDTVPEALGDGEGSMDLRYTAPDGRQQRTGAAILVSNNRYRLGQVVGAGTRPSMDEGKLGVAVFGARPGTADAEAEASPKMVDWTAPEFTLEAGHTIPAGVDGEALTFDSPLVFRTRPGVLRVRIWRGHPSASPSAGMPDSPSGAIAALARIAVGGDAATATSVASPPTHRGRATEAAT